MRDKSAHAEQDAPEGKVGKAGKARTTLTRLEVLCQSFWFALRAQHAKDDEMDMALNMLLACLRVKAEGFVEAGVYTKDLSALIKAARCAEVQDARFTYRSWSAL